jgi:uncharacterized membrane protein YhhN
VPLRYLVLAVADTTLAGLGGGRARRLRRLTKPALMPTLGWWLRTRSRESGADPVMVRATLAGLGLSATGDVALLGDDDRAFLGGVGSFLGAHLAYVAAFSRRARPWRQPGTASRLAPVALVWSTSVPVFAARAGSLRVPVAVYGSAAMQATALLLDDDVPADSRRRIAAGAACFLLSDTLLGAGRFLRQGGRDRAGRADDLLDAAVMATYTAAQWLIADGVARCPAPGQAGPQRA